MPKRLAFPGCGKTIRQEAARVKEWPAPAGHPAGRCARPAARPGWQAPRSIDFESVRARFNARSGALSVPGYAPPNAAGPRPSDIESMRAEVAAYRFVQEIPFLAGHG